MLIQRKMRIFVAEKKKIETNMIEIKQIATVEELYQAKGARTGNIFVDGVVEFLQRVPSCEAGMCAKYLKVDQRTLTSVISIFLGESLKEVILKWRLMQAIDMLDDPSIPFPTIAQHCGYRSVKQLEAAMKKYYGTTMETYRSGKLRRNSNYDINKSAESRRKVLNAAQELRKRKRMK